MKILLIEDDPGIITFLKKGLKAEGYMVVTARDGEVGSNLARHEEFDIAIIDILLPKKNGHEVLEDIQKAKKNLPVIMLSVRSDTKTKVQALNGGAVDYLTKPFDFDELLARIRVHLNRPTSGGFNTLKVGSLVLDIHKRELLCGKTRLQLSSREFSMIEYFIHNEGEVLSREQILSHVWNYNFDPSSNVVDVYIRYLREKLIELKADVAIETVRGMGYILKRKLS